MANVAWGELFFEKYERREAARSFEAALRTDAQHPAALLGMARTVAADNPPLARKFAGQTLAVNPNEAGAHVLLAELALDELDRAEAKAEIDKALAINPNHLDGLSLSAALAWLEKRTDDQAAATAAVLKINPLYGEVHRVIGGVSARSYRFDEAAEFARKAAALDRENSRAFADLGAHLMRTGDERGARRALETAFRADPFDAVTKNLLDLLDTLDDFATIRDGDMVIRLHPDEVGVMREYVPALAREALAQLTKRWNFTPTGPILIEVFPRHDDFAVRTLGLPGMIGALGACFGRVVTMDSPRARPPGEFNWGATLWHELAHVITLQLSNQRVPRWLTEGISVWEETRARPQWGREMEVTFASAMDRKQVMQLRELNSGFSNPETISLAYYQASLLVEHIVARFKEPALRELVQVFADDLDTEAAIQRALKVSIDDLQKTFDAYLDERFGRLRRALATPEGFDGDAPPDRLRALATAQPGQLPGAARARAGAGGDRSRRGAGRLRTRRRAGPDRDRRRQPAGAHRRAGVEARRQGSRRPGAGDADGQRPHRRRARRVSWSGCSISRPMPPAARRRWPGSWPSTRSMRPPTPSSAASRSPTDSCRPRSRRSGSRLPPARRIAPAPTPTSARRSRSRGRSTTPSARRCWPSRWRRRTSARRSCCCAWWSRVSDGPRRPRAWRLRPPSRPPSPWSALVAPAVSSLARAAVAQAGVFKEDRLAGLQWTFVRVKYTPTTGDLAMRTRFGFWDDPWAIDAPAAEQNLSRRVQTATAIEVGEPLVMSLDDPRLWQYPWLYLVEPSNLVLSDDEAATLREFLLRGGTLTLDDFHGSVRVGSDGAPDGARSSPTARSSTCRPRIRSSRASTSSSAIRRCPGLGSFFNGRTWEKGGFTARLRAILDDSGRPMVLINWNTDMGDGWEWSNAEDYPGYLKWTAVAYQMMINEVVYTLTH